MRYVTITLVAVAFLIYAIAFGREGVYGLLFFLPFTMTPFLINGLLAFRWQSPKSQGTLLAATLAYAAWFSYVYVDVVYLHPDAQGVLAFFFVGLLAAPALILLWLLGWGLERRRVA